MKKIRIFNLEYDQKFRDEFAQGCNEIFDDAYLTNHTKTKEFEKQFAHFNQSKYSIAVHSGTASLEVALRAANVSGKQVILPANTFIATACATLNAGGIPDIIDIEDKYYSISPTQLKKAITKNTGAVIVVHIGGHISPAIEQIVNICKENNVPLIEDCAHAHGASYKGTKCGNFGVAGCFSHFLTKIITTGEGGSIVTNSNTHLEKITSIRQFGMDPKNPITHIQQGSNFKITEFQSLLGILELKRIDKRIAKRRLLARRYQSNLETSLWHAISDNNESTGSYYKQIIIPPIDRASVTSYFKSKQIDLTGGVYYIPLHQQPSVKHFAKRSYPVADRFCSNHICPPCYPEISLDEVDYICDAMRALK